PLFPYTTLFRSSFPEAGVSESGVTLEKRASPEKSKRSTIQLHENLNGRSFPAQQPHSDSLLGVGSVIEAMDSLGFAFHTANDTRNSTRQAKFSQRNKLRGSMMGRTGLKSAPTARNVAAQT